MTGPYQGVSLVLSLLSVGLTTSLCITGRKRRDEVYVSLRGVDVMAQTLIHAMIAYMNSVDCTSLLLDPYVPYVLALRWVVFCICQNQLREWGRWVGKPVSKALKRSKENEGPVALVLVISLMVCYHKNVVTTERSLSVVAVAVAMMWPVLQVMTLNLKFRARIHCLLDGQTSGDIVTVLVHPCFFVKVGGDMLFVMLGGMYIIFVVQGMSSLLHRILCLALGLSFWLISTNLLWKQVGRDFISLLENFLPKAMIVSQPRRSLWKQMGVFLRIIAHPCRSAAGNMTKHTLCEIVSGTLIHSPAALRVRSAVLAHGAQYRSPSLPTVAKMNEALALVSGFNKDAESRALQDATIAIGFGSLTRNLRANLGCLSILLGGCPVWNGLLRRTRLRTTEILRAIEMSLVQLGGGIGDDALAIAISNKANIRLYANNALSGADEEADHMEVAEAISLGSTFLKKLLAKRRVE